MASKRLLFRSAAREKILSGASALADAVRITLGPKSKCVLIQKKWGKPIVCNDGITIAKEIELEDPEANLGAQMIREASERTGDTVGDGTAQQQFWRTPFLPKVSIMWRPELARSISNGASIAVFVLL